MTTATTNNTATDSDQEGIEIDYEELSRRDPEQFYSGTRFHESWGNNEDNLLPHFVRFISQVVQEVINDGTAAELQTSFSLDDLEQGRAAYLRPLTELTRTSIEFSVEQRTYVYSEENSISSNDAEWSDPQPSTEFPEIEPAQVQETTFPVVTAINEPNSPLVQSCRFSKRVNSRPENACPNVEPERVLDAAKLPPCILVSPWRNRPFTIFKQSEVPVHVTRKLSKRVNSTTPNAGPDKMSKSVLDVADLPPCNLGVALRKWPFTTSKQPDLPVHVTPKMSKQVDPKPPNAGPGKISKSVLDEVPPCNLGIALKKWPFATL